MLYEILFAYFILASRTLHATDSPAEAEAFSRILRAADRQDDLVTIDRPIDPEPNHDLTDLDEFGFAPIHYAAMVDDESTFTELLRRGQRASAVWNCRTSQGKTPFMLALINNQMRLVDFLLSQANVDLTAVNEAGDTALIIAVALSRFIVLDYFVTRSLELNRDIAPTYTNVQTGHTALMIAAKSLNPQPLKLLLLHATELGLNVDVTHMRIALSSSARCAKIIWDHVKSDEEHLSWIRHRDENGLTIICQEPVMQNDLLQAILATPGLRPEDANVRSAANRTPLITFAKAGYLANVQAMLRLPNLNVNAQDIDGKTALMLAAEPSVTFSYEITFALLHYPGIDATIRDNNQQTAMESAIRNGSVQLQKLYRDYIVEQYSRSRLNVWDGKDRASDPTIARASALPMVVLNRLSHNVLQNYLSNVDALPNRHREFYMHWSIEKAYQERRARRNNSNIPRMNEPALVAPVGGAEGGGNAHANTARPSARKRLRFD